MSDVWSVLYAWGAAAKIRISTARAKLTWPTGSWTRVCRSSHAPPLHLPACCCLLTWDPWSPTPVWGSAPVVLLAQSRSHWLACWPYLRRNRKLNKQLGSTLFWLDFLASWPGVTLGIWFVGLTTSLSPDSDLLVSWPSWLLSCDRQLWLWLLGLAVTTCSDHNQCEGPSLVRDGWT